MRLFGTDGFRGKAGDIINSQRAMKLGMAAGIYFKRSSKTNKIIVGKDTRRSGYMIENAIVSGLTAVGYDVIQIGPMPTPSVAFLTQNMRCDAGIMISASHNHYSDNGIKFFSAQGEKLNSRAEKSIEHIYFEKSILKYGRKVGLDIGVSRRIDDVIGRYIVHIKNSFPKNLTMRGLRIVLDVANGAAYKVAPTIFEELEAEVIVINDKPNGYNINYNCGALHPKELSKTVKDFRADIGFSFDGDADRLVVVDERGNIIDGDKILAILAIHLKKRGGLKNRSIVTTVMSNKALSDYLKKKGIKNIKSDVGDKSVFKIMKKNSLNFGGEQSGHIIFSDFAKTGDGIVAALQIVAYILEYKKASHKALNPFKPYPRVYKNIKMKKMKKRAPIDKIKGYKNIVNMLKKDKIKYVIRYSGTEDLIRVLLEGKDKNILNRRLKRVVKLFEHMSI